MSFGPTGNIIRVKSMKYMPKAVFKDGKSRTPIKSFHSNYPTSIVLFSSDGFSNSSGVGGGSDGFSKY